MGVSSTIVTRLNHRKLFPWTAHGYVRRIRSNGRTMAFGHEDVTTGRANLGLFRKRLTRQRNRSSLQRETPLTYNVDKGRAVAAALQPHLAPALFV